MRLLALCFSKLWAPDGGEKTAAPIKIVRAGGCLVNLGRYLSGINR